MKNESRFRVLIVGCGQLGSRHLQAVATLPFVKTIEVVDTRPDAIELGRKRLQEIGLVNHETRVRWMSSFTDASPEGDLCIVATQAEGRCELVRVIAGQLGISTFLLEKLVSPSVREYLDLLTYCRKKGLRVWVNCKTRAHASHQHVKRNIPAGEPLILSVAGGNHGLASNGVHAADLFVFFDGTDRVEPTASLIDPLLHPSKRGGHIFDLSGTIHAHSKTGSVFTLSLASTHQAPLQFSIVTSRYRALVDDMMKVFYESDADSGWSWREVPFNANLMVSHMTREFVSGILTRGHCELPTLEECFPAHRLILDALRPHFNRLLVTDTESCPVT